MLKYYKRLCTSDDILLRNAYKESSAAHDQDRMCQTHLEFLDLDIFALSKSTFKQSNNSIINELKYVYNKVWNK